MKMKKWISIVAATAMAAGLLAGCGASDSAAGGPETEETTEAPEAEETAGEPETEEATEAPEDSAETESAGGTLVVYYSASGHTADVAAAIADATDGDLFELVPAEPYTDEDLDWTNDDSRVTVEYNNPDQRDVELVSAAVDIWDSYDTVFIGYPIWWGIAAWPVDGFVEANDFTGKTVIPFCTSASSGLGESGELLEELAGTGDWQEGMRFRSSASDEDVQAWIAELGM